jgi:hypothetical protein
MEASDGDVVADEAVKRSHLVDDPAIGSAVHGHAIEAVADSEHLFEGARHRAETRAPRKHERPVDVEEYELDHGPTTPL